MADEWESPEFHVSLFVESHVCELSGWVSKITTIITACQVTTGYQGTLRYQQKVRLVAADSCSDT